MEEKHSRIIYWDQDVLNSYYSGNFQHLDEYLNFNLDLNQYSEESLQHIKNNVIFLHYSGNGKPWKYDSVFKPNSSFYQNAYKKMFNSNQPGIFEIVINPSQGFSPKLTSRKLKDGTMVSPSLHDMSPFLDEDELAKNIL